MQSEHSLGLVWHLGIPVCLVFTLTQFPATVLGGGLSPGCTNGGKLGGRSHRGDHGHKLGAWSVDVLQSSGWILEGPEEGPGIHWQLLGTLGG